MGWVNTINPNKGLASQVNFHGNYLHLVEQNRMVFVRWSGLSAANSVTTAREWVAIIL